MLLVKLWKEDNFHSITGSKSSPCKTHCWFRKENSIFQHYTTHVKVNSAFFKFFKLALHLLNFQHRQFFFFLFNGTRMLVPENICLIIRFCLCIYTLWLNYKQM